MDKKIYIGILLLAVGMIFSFTSCDNDDLDSTSIFTDVETDEEGRVGLNPNSYSYELDRWLWDNYLLPYNLQYRYKMQDVGADMNYNLVPTRYEKAIDMAVLTKYLWFDVYDKIVGPNFLKLYGPRIIHLIGSAAYNPNNGTKILGLAEGGIKVSLFQCNDMDYNDIDYMNEQYFKTMHHEFSHILHQMKTYPKDFRLISTAHYMPFNWESREHEEAASLGFVSPYAGSETQEDFVEVIANYIVKTDAQWNKILEMAEKEYNTDDEGNIVYDGVNGREVILEKLEICKNWLSSAWGVELDDIRNEVQYRQANIDIEFLRSQITADYE
ncbi:putative zinc-binding metallopeptidase [Bacteroidales bacterium OttesenSCG-928-M11]|nr:putative zinc-binding metallopeptidase [Bacteroidales bacterium OttesenSCG-928-M11]